MKTNYFETLQALAKGMQASERHEKRVAKRERRRERERAKEARMQAVAEAESAHFARTTFQDCKGVRTRKRCTEHVGRVAGCKIRDVRTGENSVVVCKSRMY